MSDSSLILRSAVLAAAVLIACSSAIAEQSGDFTYSINTTAVTITGYTGPGGDVAIPPAIAGKPVTRVGDQAFYNKPALASVTLPDGITHIGNHAFSWCASLRSVLIPEGVSSIGNLAFYNCDGLAGVRIPASVETIGQGAFSNCGILAAITVDERSTRFRSEGGVLFNHAATLLIQYPGGKSGNFEVPAGVTAIGYSAFAYCGGLRSVIFPPGLQDIGDHAFRECRGLGSIVIPEGVTRIGLWAFYVCGGLTSVSLPDSVTSIGENAFYQCGGLTQFTIPVGVVSIGDGAFSGCGGIAGFEVSGENASFSAVDGVLFDKSGGIIVRCPQAKAGHFIIPKAATAIGNWAFSDCRGITGVTIPGSVSRIGERAFVNCTGLGELMLPSQVSFIGAHAFSYCTRLAAVVIPAGVTEIGDGAFGNCYRLEKFTVETTNAHFMDVDGVLFDKSRTSLIQYPTGRSGRYSIPADVNVIRGSAFSGAYLMNQVDIPAGVTDIRNFAFAYCSSLMMAEFAGAAPRVGIHLFLYAPAGFSVSYRAGSVGFTSPLWNTYPAMAIPLSGVDAWRFSHFGNAENSGPGADGEDADGDGQTNLAEYAADTDPKNPTDSFSQISHQFLAGSFVVEIPGRAGRSYRLLRGAENALERWTPVASAGPLPADGPLTLADPSPDGGRGFYKVEVTIP